MKTHGDELIVSFPDVDPRANLRIHFRAVGRRCLSLACKHISLRQETLCIAKKRLRSLSCWL